MDTAKTHEETSLKVFNCPLDIALILSRILFWKSHEPPSKFASVSASRRQRILKNPQLIFCRSQPETYSTPVPLTICKIPTSEFSPVLGSQFLTGTDRRNLHFASSIPVPTSLRPSRCDDKQLHPGVGLHYGREKRIFKTNESKPRTTNL